MKISLFKEFSSLAGQDVFEAFEKSLDEEVVYNDMEADVAVIWSVLWHGRMAKNKEVWDHYRIQNKPVIVLEVGGLKRNQTWKVGINGVNRDAIFCNSDNLIPNRWDTFGIDLKPWRTNGEHIVICGQHGQSEQRRRLEDNKNYMFHTINEIRQHSDRPIQIRPHPRDTFENPFPHNESITWIDPKQLPGSYDNFDFHKSLENAWAVVSYSSNPAIESVINGIPVFVSEHSLSYDVGNHDLVYLEEPAMPDRSQWCEEISHTEWTIDEIRDGIPWQRIKHTIVENY